jgi:hypothetical protein
VMTIRLEPKPIRTGATLHIICITAGASWTYKLFAKLYGGKSDSYEDIATCNYAYSAIPRVRKILLKLLRIETENYSHHHDNGNVSNRTSMGIDLFNTNL